MKYGLIGEKLGHSFSKEIHEKMNNYKYDLIELDRSEIDIFKEKNLKESMLLFPTKLL